MIWSVSHAGMSDRGNVRSANEDAWVALSDQGIYLVADGMGGAAEGGLASNLVAQTLPLLIEQRLTSLEHPTSDTMAAEVRKAIADLSRRLRNEVSDDSGLAAMGSTIVVAVVWPPVAIIAHLGDSRAYLMREERLERCTDDHSLSQLLFDVGEINQDQLAVHQARNQLTRYVGMQGEAEADVRIQRLLSGDRILLCTDGLSSMVSDEDIESTLRDSASLSHSGRELVELAKAAGGHDNITALLIEISGAAVDDSDSTYSEGDLEDKGYESSDTQFPDVAR